MPDSQMAYGMLDTGWHLVWFNEYGAKAVSPERLAGLSQDRDVLLCMVEEHVMASSAEYWSGGSRVWSISHQGEDGPKGLTTEGALPEGFDAIRREMEETQRAEGDDAGVDYIFEIPLKVAENLVGFKHDEGWDHLVGERFDILTTR